MRVYLVILSLYTSISAAEIISNDYNVNVDFNIVTPVCKLQTLHESLHFGEFDKLSIKDTTPEARAVLTFSGCTGVSRLNIGFSGNYIDNIKNVLTNASGTNYASGIGIKMYDSKEKEVNLQGGLVEYINGASSYDLVLKAKIISEHESLRRITPGEIKSAVTLIITYS